MEFAADLSPRQLAALSKGRKIRIAHKLMGRGVGFVVHPNTHHKLTRAFANKKGADIQLSPDEVEANGGKIGRSKKFNRWMGNLGSVVSAVGDFVKPAFVPIREALVNRAVTQIDPAAAAQRNLEEATGTLGNLFRPKQEPQLNRPNQESPYQAALGSLFRPKTPTPVAGPAPSNPMVNYSQYNAQNDTNYGYQTQAGLAQAYANAYQPYPQYQLPSGIANAYQPHSMQSIAPQTSSYNIDSYNPVYAYGGLSSYERYNGRGISGGKLASIGAKGQPVWGNLQARASQAEMTGFKQQIAPIYRLQGAGLYL